MSNVILGGAMSISKLLRSAVLTGCALALPISADAGTARAATKAEIEVVRAAMQEKLKDADSAKFKDVMFARDGDGVATVCGLVNAKNSFGAYDGFERFYAAYIPKEGQMRSAVAALVTIGNNSVTATMCAKGGL